jgi:tripartite-type tricarboxylate transporter receptor subunit TctC
LPVVLGNVAVGGGLQIDDRMEDAALEAPFRQIREEALDSVEPRARSRVKWKVKRLSVRGDEDTMTSTPNLAASAQDYPARPVRIIEPFGAGGGPDLLARALASKLSELWGQPVTVENIPGAGATAGPAQVAKSAADGYTLLINTNAQAYSAALSKDLPYDPLQDFIPVIPLTRQAYVLVAGKAAGVTTVSELIAAAKAKPGELKFGSTGIGTGTHVGVEKFNQAAGIKAPHMPPSPNDSNADTIANAIAGRFNYYLVPISLALPHIRDGTLVALGVSTAKRSTELCRNLGDGLIRRRG